MDREKRREYKRKYLEKHPNYYKEVWNKIKSDPKKLEKKRKIDVEYERKRRKKKGLKTEEFRIWRLKNPYKYKAQSILNHAVSSGKIIRMPCEVCGDKRRYYIHAHHDDYKFPLKVRWLCVIHHKKYHKEK